MSITRTSGVAVSTRSNSSAPVETAATLKPSSRRPRPRTPRSSASSSTTRMVCPYTDMSMDAPCVPTSFLAQDRTEGEEPDLERGKRRGREAADERGGAEPAEEQPRDSELVGRRVEDVLQHRHEHLGEQPAEQRREHECRHEHERGLAPEEGARSAERRAESHHRREPPPPRAPRAQPPPRRSARPTATKKAIAAAASTSTNASSIRLIPRRSTVVIE